MKLPKLIGNLTPDAAVGFADARALQNTGAPFLTAKGPGYTTRLKNGFVEVRTHETKPETAKPYLWFLQHPVNSPDFPTQAVVAEPGKKKRKLLPESDLILNSAYSTNQGLFVGANRIATIRMDNTATVNYVSPTRAVLAAVGGAAEAPLGTAGRAWSYPAAAAFPRSLFATGWDAIRRTWRWGWSSKPPTLWQFYYPSTVPSFADQYLTRQAHWSSIPSVHTADTAGSTQVSNLLSSESATRGHEGGQVYCVGRGKLVSVIAVHDYAYPNPADPFGNYIKDRTEPFVMTSADHGDTWARSTASFLAPFLRPGGTNGVEVYSYIALRDLMRDSFMVYVGAGKALFFAVGAYESAVKKNLCFLYQAGTFTRLSWGFDTAASFPYRAFTDSPSGVPFFQGGIAAVDRRMNLPVSYCFGPGCCAIFASGGGTFLRVTYDSGVTWIVLNAAAFPNALSFITIKPYRSPQLPGKILMRGSVGYYVTDGTFASFRFLGTVGPLGTDGGAVFVNLRKSLYPELPDEFGPP